MTSSTATHGRPITLSPGDLVEAYIELKETGSGFSMDGEYQGRVEAIINGHAVFTVTEGETSDAIGRVVSVPLADVRALCDVPDDQDDVEEEARTLATHRIVSAADCMPLDMVQALAVKLERKYGSTDPRFPMHHDDDANQTGPEDVEPETETVGERVVLRPGQEVIVYRITDKLDTPWPGIIREVTRSGAVVDPMPDHAGQTIFAEADDIHVRAAAEGGAQ